MLRAACIPRSQSRVINCLLIAKRCQQTTTSSTSAGGVNKSQSATKSSASTSSTKPTSGATSSSKSTATVKSTIPHYSTRSDPSSGGKRGGGAGRTAKAVIYGVTLGLTATLAYAEYENDTFRRQLESTIPYTATILDGLDQFIDPILGRQKPSTPQVSDKIPDLGFVKEKPTTTTEKTKTIGEQPKELPKPAVEKSTDKAQTQKVTDKVTDTKKAKSSTEQVTDQVKDAVNTVREALPSKETIKKKASQAKEHVEDAAHAVKEKVKDVLPSAKTEPSETAKKVVDPVPVAEAVKAIVTPPEDTFKKLEEEITQLVTPLSTQIDDALKAAREHITHMKTLIDNPNVSMSDQEIWKKAEQLQEQAKVAYEQATTTLRQWKDKAVEYSKSANGAIHPNEKSIDEKFQELQKEFTTSTFVKNFRTYIDEATKAFQKEIETMFPSLAGKSPLQLTHDDLQALLVHAHRRIVKLQNDIARMRVYEADSVKAAVDLALADLDRLVEQNAQQRIEKTVEQLTTEVKLYEKNLRQQFDEQLRYEIVLQHQALTQYLQDVLSRQYQEWASEFQRQLEDKSIKITIDLQDQLRSSLDRLHAIEKAIEANHDSQIRGRQAQQLWIQAQNLLNCIVNGTIKEGDLEATAKIVPNEKFVQVLINELKDDDVSQTTNERILRERFTHVKTLCRRVALIDNEHNSLMHYFLSYLQSLLIVRQRDDSILNDDAIDLNKLDTFVILNYVQSYLEQNQWYNALRLMQLLTGEPRNVAQSWINDTRKYLARKQTSELLEAYSNSIGLGTLPKTA